MKKLITIYKVVCAGFLAGVFTVACTEEDWGKQGGAQGGITLSSYKEKVVSRAMESGDDNFAQGTKYRIWVMNQGTSTPEEADETNGIEATESKRGGIPVIDMRPIERTTPDFYGFTQNSKVDVPEAKEVTDIYSIALQTETNDYIDYLRGELHAPYQPEDYAQGDILQMPFRHIMSQVTFQVSKDTEVDTEIKLVKIEMIGSDQNNPGTVNITSKGTYQVFTNEFEFTESEVRKIDGNNMDVPEADIASENVGELNPILIFPTFATSESTETVPLTYLKVTFTDSEDYYKQQDAEGNSQVIVPIYNTITSVEGQSAPLEFKQNYHYTLHIAFSSDIRRVVTLVPKVYEWIEGEGDASNDYMQEQDMGQPVTFNGVLWSDRNLGATSGDPTRSVDDWYNSIGYVYQYGRNIPYFPYNYSNGVIDYTTPASEALGTNGRKVYPVIDYEAWGNNITNWALAPNSNPGDLVWDLTSAEGYDGGERLNFGYFNSEAYNFEKLDGYNREWIENKKTPCPPGWRLPTVRDFMGVMPSSGFSGNITFRRFTGISDNGSWQGDDVDLNTGAFSADRIDDYKDTFWKDDNSVVYKGAFPYIYREETDDFLDGANAKGVYILSMGEGDRRQVVDNSPASLRSGFTFNWGVIYGIKNQGERDAYRIRWHIELVNDESNSPSIRNGVETYTQNPFHGLLVISRYEASENDNFNMQRGDESYGDVIKRYDWEHPVEVMYLPVGGYCDATTSKGALNNIGTEVWYATSELNTGTTDKKKMIWIKYAGTAARNSQTIAVNDQSYLGAAVYVRCVRDLYNTGNN